MSNGYEIRLELLKMAKDVLAQRFETDMKKATLAWNSGLPESFSFPIPFTMDDIIREAIQLSRFVNNKQ
jgi:hypothetical protein